MTNVSHRSPDSENWNVQYILMRLPHPIRTASCSSAECAMKSEHQPLNAKWVYGNPQCSIFAQLQAGADAYTLLAFLAEPLVRIRSLNESTNKWWRERRGEGERREGERRKNTLILIKEFIDKSLDRESLDVALIGHQFGLSRSSVYRLFEPEGGLANYIRRRRLIQAFSLLVAPPVQGRLRILDVAVECGFSSDAVFARAFRKMFSLTPSMVRSMGELQVPELDVILTRLHK